MGGRDGRAGLWLIWVVDGLLLGAGLWAGRVKGALAEWPWMLSGPRWH